MLQSCSFGSTSDIVAGWTPLQPAAACSRQRWLTSVAPTPTRSLVLVQLQTSSLAERRCSLQRRVAVNADFHGTDPNSIPGFASTSDIVAGWMPVQPAAACSRQRWLTSMAPTRTRSLVLLQLQTSSLAECRCSLQRRVAVNAGWLSWHRAQLDSCIRKLSWSNAAALDGDYRDCVGAVCCRLVQRRKWLEGNREINLVSKLCKFEENAGCKGRCCWLDATSGLVIANTVCCHVVVGDLGFAKIFDLLQGLLATTEGS